MRTKKGAKVKENYTKAQSGVFIFLFGCCLVALAPDREADVPVKQYPEVVCIG
jgi:hypothetical protein